MTPVIERCLEWLEKCTDLATLATVHDGDGSSPPGSCCSCDYIQELVRQALTCVSSQVRSATMFVDHSEDTEREGGVMSDIMAQVWDLVLDRHQHPCKAAPASKAAARHDQDLLSAQDSPPLEKGSTLIAAAIDRLALSD